MLVICPHCQQTSEVGTELVEGQHVKCAYCGLKFDYHRPKEAEPPLPSLKAGQSVGAYKILRCIGQGGMGAVYEVEHVTLGAHFAMKVFTAQAEDEHDDILRQKFLEEAKQLSAIKHANIAHVFDLSVDNATGAPYFVMDLVTYAGGEPCTLNDLDHSKIEEDLVFLWFSEMCRVLGYVHSLNIIHRDIKLENILLNQDQHVVLTDFGVAKVYEGLAMRAVQGGCKTSGTKDENLIFGTPHYMAPEVEQGEAVTAAADVYSLGVAFFRLLTGDWYDEHPESLKKLARRKYGWIPVLAAMLAPVDRRPTDLSGFPRKLSGKVATKFRQAGTWKLVLADKKKKSKLFAEIEKRKRRQEAREHKKQRLKKTFAIALVAEAAMFAGLAYYAYTPRTSKRTVHETAYEDTGYEQELKIKEAYQDLQNKWRDISVRHRTQFPKNVESYKEAMEKLDGMALDVDYSDKVSTAIFARQVAELDRTVSAFDQNCRAWKSLYYLSGECERLIDAIKKDSIPTDPSFSNDLRTAEALRHEGNIFKMQDEYMEAEKRYKQCIQLVEALQFRIRQARARRD